MPESQSSPREPIPLAAVPPRSASLPHNSLNLTSNSSSSAPPSEPRSSEGDRVLSGSLTPTAGTRQDPLASPLGTQPRPVRVQPLHVDTTTSSSSHAVSPSLYATHPPSLTPHNPVTALKPIMEASQPSQESKAHLPDEGTSYIGGTGESLLSILNHAGCSCFPVSESWQSGLEVPKSSDANGPRGQKTSPTMEHTYIGDHDQFLDLSTDDHEQQYTPAPPSREEHKPRPNTEESPMPLSHTSLSAVQSSGHSLGSASTSTHTQAHHRPSLHESLAPREQKPQSSSQLQPLAEVSALSPDSPLSPYLSMKSPGSSAVFRSLPLINSDLRTTRITVLYSSVKPNDRGKDVLSFVIEVDPNNGGKEPWRVEKLYSDFLAFDQRVRSAVGKSMAKKVDPLPEGKIWKDHAPAKADQRKVCMLSPLGTDCPMIMLTNTGKT